MQEIAAAPASQLVAWSVRDGRLLRFAPEWPESSERVTFDACSGDYWVLDDLGYRVVRCLLDGGAMSTEHLDLAIARSGAPAVERGDLELVLERLSEAGLIQIAQACAS